MMTNAQPGPDLPTVKDLADYCGKVAVQLKELLDRTLVFVCSRPATAAEGPKQVRIDLHGALEDTLHCLRSALQDAHDLSRLLGAESNSTGEIVARQQEQRELQQQFLQRW